MKFNFELLSLFSIVFFTIIRYNINVVLGAFAFDATCSIV